MKNVEVFVENYKTKYEEGFTFEEVKEMLSKFVYIDKKKFYKDLGCVTGVMVNEEFVVYPCYVTTALRCGIEKKKT
jgi:hypothetical protein